MDVLILHQVGVMLLKITNNLNYVHIKLFIVKGIENLRSRLLCFYQSELKTLVQQNGSTI